MPNVSYIFSFQPHLSQPCIPLQELTGRCALLIQERKTKAEPSLLRCCGTTQVTFKYSPLLVKVQLCLLPGQWSPDFLSSNFHYFVVLVSSPNLCPCAFMSVFKSFYWHLCGLSRESSSKTVFKFQSKQKSSYWCFLCILNPGCAWKSIFLPPAWNRLSSLGYPASHWHASIQTQIKWHLISLSRVVTCSSGLSWHSFLAFIFIAYRKYPLWEDTPFFVGVTAHRHFFHIFITEFYISIYF